MKITKDKSDDSRNLREQAEKKAKQQIVEFRKQRGQDTAELIHELRVHQIELEIQNEELRNTQLELAESRNKYCELYDFAPVGYFTLNKEGVIVGANLTGAASLGEERDNLLRSKFSHFVAPGSQDEFYLHRRQVVESGTMQSCEVKLRRKDGTEFPAQLVSVAVAEQKGEYDQFRMTMTDITERKKAEGTLRESEERLNTALDAAELGIWDWDLISGRIIWAGHHARLLGYKEDEFDGRYETFEKRVHPDDIAGLNSAIEKAKNGCSEYSYEYRVVWPDGTVRWILGKGRCHYDQTGQAVRMTGTVQDITERKQAEEELRKERDFAGSLVETAQAIILVLDTQGRIVDFNPYMEEVSGYRLEEVQGSDWFGTFLPERDRQRVRELFSKAISGIQTRGNVNPIVTKSGNERQIEWYDKALKDSTGNIVGLLTIGQDITERKKAEEALRESEGKFKTLAEESFDSIVIHDGQNVIEVNKAFGKIWGWELQQAIGASTDEFITKESLKVIRERIKCGYDKPYEVVGIRRDGTRFPLEITGKPITYKGKPARIVTARDITERKRTEQALKEGEKRYRRFYEDAPLGYQSLDAEGCFIDVNSAWLELLGYRREEVIGRWFGDFHTRESLELFRERFPRFKAAGTVRNAECELVCKDGSRIIVSIDGKISYDEHGDFKQTHCILHNVTEQKRAEESLRESEDKFRHVFDYSVIGKSITLPSSGKMQVNKALCEMLGYSKEELKVKKWQEITHPDDIEDSQKVVDSILSGQQGSVQFFKRYIHKNGSVVWADVSTSLRRDNEGKPLYLMTSVVNITERKRAEEELRKEKDFAKSLVETAQAIVLVLDTRGRIASFNPYMEEISGYKLEEVLGFDWFSTFVPKRNREHIRDLFKNATTDIPTRGNVNPIVTKKGEEREIEWYDKALKDSSGNIIGLLATGQDITERKRAEEQLQEERNLLRTLIDHIPDGVYVKDKDSRFVALNNAVTEYWDTKGQGDIIGKTDFDFFDKDKAQQFFDEEQEIIRTGQPIINLERPCISKTGKTNWVLATKVPLRDSHGNIIGTVGVNHDITERKKAEEEMRRLNRVMETITDVNQLIFRIQDRDELLRKACEALVKYAYRMVWIGFCDEKSKQIVPQAQAGFEEGYLDSVKITYNGSEHGMGPSGMAVKTAGPDIMQFIATDPQFEPWRAEAIKRGYRSSAAIPIFGADKVVGTLNVYADKDDAFNQEEVKLLEELSHDISTALKGIDEQAKRRVAEEKLFEHRKQLKRLAAQLALAEERERRRIAGELHDHVGQSLALAKIKLDALRASATSRPANDVLAEVSETLQQLIDKTRSLTFDLSNPILYELGFEAAVSEWLNEQVRDKHGIGTEFQDDGRPKPLDDDVRVLLFRNVRELLINVIKYANADKVKVRIRRIDGSIEVTVKDNGIGFDPIEVRSMAAKRTEFGLLSIRESLEELGGRFEIESKPGAGCKAVMTAPLKGQLRKKEE